MVHHSSHSTVLQVNVLDYNHQGEYFTVTIRSLYPDVDVKVLSYSTADMIFYIYGRNAETPHPIIEPINPPDPGPDSHEMVVKVFRCHVGISLDVTLNIVTQSNEVLPSFRTLLYDFSCEC